MVETMDPTAHGNWWSRNWRWFVPVGCLSTLLLLAGGVAMVLSLVFGMMKQSDAYQQGLALAKASPAVLEALGSPLHAGFFTSGNVNVNGPSGNAELSIPISGPKGDGTIYLEATKSAGAWTFSTLLVELDASHVRIDLLAPTERARVPLSDREQ